MRSGVGEQKVRVRKPRQGIRISSSNGYRCRPILLLLACGFATIFSSRVVACPFCTAVSPSFAQQRESADVVALAEVLDAAAQPPRFRLHRIVKGEKELSDRAMLSADVQAALKPTTLVLLLANKGGDNKLTWSALAVDEISAAYFLGAPGLRLPEVERLRYFAPFLEHPDPAIAEDAYREFGVARFDAVGKVADLVPSDRLRDWLQSERVPQSHKGLYGLMLGLAQDKRTRQENADFLKQQIEADENDFRAGFDGVVGGYLLLAGDEGLKRIEERFLANPNAAVGDVRHALTALRFYQEFGREISPSHLRAAVAKALVRPEFAETVITDLARLRGWEFCDAVAALYDRPGYDTREIRRAIVGYLLACPPPDGPKQLAQLRQRDPKGVDAAEEVLHKLGRVPQ